MSTYGELMDKAMTALAAAITAPIRFSNVDPFDLDRTLMVLRGRARLYRGLAGALRATLDHTPRHNQDPAASRAITALYDEVSASATAVATILADPGPPRLPWDARRYREMPHKLLRAADLAGGAWDLAALYLLPPGSRRRTPDMTVEATQALSRQVEIDAAEIAAALGDLDGLLASRLAVWEHHRPPGTPGLAITVALDDTRRSSRGLITHHATTYLATTQTPTTLRAHSVQALSTFPTRDPRSIRTPRTGAAAIQLLRQRMHDDTGTLTTYDLANIARVGHRVTLLTALAARDQPQPDQALHDRAVAAAGQWRRLEMALRDIRPLGPPAETAAVTVNITGWANRHLRPDNPTPLVPEHGPRTWPDWTTALQEATAYLPDLARLTGRHLATQLRAGNIVTHDGIDATRRFSPPTAEQVNQLVALLDTVNSHSVDLAHHAFAANPDLHPVPHVVNRAERLADRSVWPHDTAPGELYPPLTGAVHDERARRDNTYREPSSGAEPPRARGPRRPPVLRGTTTSAP